MKKLMSIFLCLTFIILSIFIVPTTASAAVYKPNTDIYANAYMLINLDDSTYPVVAQKNQDEKVYPASLTKIVTAMVTINNVKDLSQKVKMSQTAYDSLADTGAQVAGIEVGETVTVKELLYLTMVHSACDACQMLAEFVAGDTPTFAQKMNEWVKSLGCKNTNFVNADGLHDENHYTTASDMAKITLAAMKNDTFMQIATTQSYEYKNMTLVHTNYMLDKFHVSYYYEYAQGIKTGSTKEAGYCVITKASKDGYNYLAVVMGSPIKNINGIDTKCSFIDAKSLFEWAFNSLKYTTVIRENDIVSELPIVDGKDADTVQLVAQKDVTTLVPSSLDPSAVIIKPINQPDQLKAPINKGDKICDANIIYGGEVIAKTKLVSAQTVELSTFLKIINGVKKFFSNKIVKVVIFLILLACILYLVLLFTKLRKAKVLEDKKRKRQQQLDEQLDNEFDDLQPPVR